MAATSTHRIPRDKASASWYSPYDYSFFILNWKYRPNEPMESRNLLDVLWQVKDTPESERPEDFQSFLPGAHVERQKIRQALLRSYAHDQKHDDLVPMSLSFTMKDRQQALKCGRLNAKEVQAYQEVEEQKDSTSFIAEYVDSIFNDWNPLNFWLGSACQSPPPPPTTTTTQGSDKDV